MNSIVLSGLAEANHNTTCTRNMRKFGYQGFRLRFSQAFVFCQDSPGTRGRFNGQILDGICARCELKGLSKLIEMYGTDSTKDRSHAMWKIRLHENDWIRRLCKSGKDARNAKNDWHAALMDWSVDQFHFEPSYSAKVSSASCASLTLSFVICKPVYELYLYKYIKLTNNKMLGALSPNTTVDNGGRKPVWRASIQSMTLSNGQQHYYKRAAGATGAAAKNCSSLQQLAVWPIGALFILKPQWL